MNVFTRFYSNVRLFPPFTTFVAIVYTLTGLALAVPFAVHIHSISEGVAISALVLALCAAIDLILYFVIASNRMWLSKCERMADAFARIFLSPTQAETQDAEPPCPDCRFSHSFPHL